MIGYLIIAVVGLLATLVLVLHSAASLAARPTGEQTGQAASELYRIGRELDADELKAAIRRNARDTERQMLRELDD